MEALRRDIKVEKPGRLELAILEWQRQLVAKRAAGGEPLIREREQPRPGLAADSSVTRGDRGVRP